MRIKRYDRGGWKSAIGLEITKYDRAGLHIVIEFGLQSATKILKNGLWSAMGLQTATDYKVIQCNIDMLLMIGKGIIGRICHAIHWYTKANNKCMKYYDKNKESSYL